MTEKTLEENYLGYKRHLEEAVIEGQLQDEELAQRFGFPSNLLLFPNEKEQLTEFVMDRVEEIFNEFLELDEVHPIIVGHYLLNSVLSGMLWQQERGLESFPESLDST